ncbi:hypothetical protein L6452_09965 [Arctium lappa]|uniref:Uncharacterized protein n=1 Tax=Arctium lappa TaxID=4217 RepID=A0ACB9DMS0_ARCLA|nr:hypothetical protein L6452_09965 [Arctium lappa]
MVAIKKLDHVIVEGTTTTTLLLFSVRDFMSPELVVLARKKWYQVSSTDYFIKKATAGAGSMIHHLRLEEGARKATQELEKLSEAYDIDILVDLLYVYGMA